MNLINKKMFQNNTKYTFTINPDDSFQFFGSISRLSKALRATGSYMARLSHAEYTLYPEISRKGRIHWHGYITIDNAAMFQLYDVPYICKKYIYEIDALTDPEIWQRYIEKDKAQMKLATNHIQKPYKLTNILKPPTTPILDAFIKVGSNGLPSASEARLNPLCDQTLQDVVDPLGT